jgi:hypothetical protein
MALALIWSPLPTRITKFLQRRQSMSMILILKLILVPALIAGVTLAGRRWGPSVAGWLSAFPVVSAPILFFIALQHGSAFTAQAAVGTLSAVLAILAFGISYSWAATGQSLVGGFVATLQQSHA